MHLVISHVRHTAVMILAVLLGLIVPAGPSAGTAPQGTHRNDSQSPFVGTWAGTIDQPGSGSYRVRLTIRKSGTGFRANVRYRSLLCGGRWSFVSKEGRTLRFVENITYNGVCGTGVDVSVTRRSDGNLDYRFDAATAYGTGTLRPASGRPVGPGNKPVGHGLAQWPTDQGEAGSALMVWFGAAWRVGEWDLGLPAWSSCIEQDLCLAGRDLQVGLVARGDYGFYTVDEFSVDMPARYWLEHLGYDSATITALLS